MSGGFAFLLVYLVLAVLVGLAVMVGEFTIGRKTGMSPVAAYRKLSKKFTWMGCMAVLVPFLVLCFYFVLGGMVMRYALGYLTAIFGWDTWNVADISEFFGTFILNGGQMILWTAIFIALNAFIVAAGVAEGIEKFCKIGMPALFIMLLIVIVYVAVQPGAMDGYKFMFGWNVEPLKEDFLKVLKTAAGQMFFSLSLGMGAMITYGSYLKKQESIQKNAVIVVICDTLVAIMAGMISYACLLRIPRRRDQLRPGTPCSCLCRSSSTRWATSATSWASCSTPLFSSQQFLLPSPCLRSLPPSRLTRTLQRARLPDAKKYAILAAVIIFVFCLPTCLDGLGAGTNGGATIGSPADILGMHWAEAGDISNLPTAPITM